MDQKNEYQKNIENQVKDIQDLKVQKQEISKNIKELNGKLV